MKIKLSFVFLLLTIVGLSQSNEKRLFENGDRVCFVGNSITHGGGFHHNIMLYQMTRFPEEKITFYNCGIGGNQAHDILERMESDILVHNPTHAVIMLGMNDVHRNLYGINFTGDSDTLKMRREAIDNYKSSLDSIVRIFQSKDIKVLLQKPSIYDQTAIIPGLNYYGVNDALKECAAFNQQLAMKYNLSVIDYWSIMSKINKEIQKKDPTATIIGKDRVHPGETGQFIMAYQFLKEMEAPGYVSKIVVDKGKSSKQSLNCDVDMISNDSPDYVSFRVTEKALPFPIFEDQKDGINLVPFTEEFNNQLLKLKRLKSGQYQLKIDDIVIGNFSSKQLKNGINLAEFENTPQYCQSENVLKTLHELWKLEGFLRDIKFVEFTSYYKNYTGDKNDLNEFQKYFNEQISKSEYKTYMKYVLDNYMKNKPKQNDYKNDIVKLREEAYQQVQPVEHSFEITKISSENNKW